jgi:hypothetical protein
MVGQYTSVAQLYGAVKSIVNYGGNARDCFTILYLGVSDRRSKLHQHMLQQYTGVGSPKTYTKSCRVVLSENLSSQKPDTDSASDYLYS